MFSTVTHTYPGHCLVYLRLHGDCIAYGSGANEQAAREHRLRFVVELRDELSRWVEQETEALNGGA